MVLASVILPLASSHLGDSGRKKRRKGASTAGADTTWKMVAQWGREWATATARARPVGQANCIPMDRTTFHLPVHSSATQTKATVKLAMAAMPTSHQRKTKAAEFGTKEVTIPLEAISRENRAMDLFLPN